MTPLSPVFVLVVAFMIPPSQPVVQNLEVLGNLYFFTGLAWAWVGLRQQAGPFLLILARARSVCRRAGAIAGGSEQDCSGGSEVVSRDADAALLTGRAYLRNDPTVFNLHLVSVPQHSSPLTVDLQRDICRGKVGRRLRRVSGCGRWQLGKAP